ncbi:MAG: hypothetical protein DRJ37_01880 [Thermoprotei archaeon]|nr:MAG: hypothetical protein DRJ37_01880 [Thermoprotei archaeon]
MLPFSEKLEPLMNIGYVKVYFNRRFGHIRVEIYISDWSRVRPALGAARSAIIKALTAKWGLAKYCLEN